MLFLVICFLLAVGFLHFNRFQVNDRCQQTFAADPHTIRQNDASNVTGTLAYLSKGKLFFKKPASKPEEIHSAYIQGFLEKKEKSQNLHDWKEATAWGTNHVGKQTVTSDDSQPIKFQSVQTTDDGNLLYFLTGNGFKQNKKMAVLKV